MSFFHLFKKNIYIHTLGLGGCDTPSFLLTFPSPTPLTHSASVEIVSFDARRDVERGQISHSLRLIFRYCWYGCPQGKEPAESSKSILVFSFQSNLRDHPATPLAPDRAPWHSPVLLRPLSGRGASLWAAVPASTLSHQL